MWRKCDDHGFPVQISSSLFQLLKNLPVAHMHTIEIAYGGHRVFQCLDI
jgi:hypothetical protein